MCVIDSNEEAVSNDFHTTAPEELVIKVAESDAEREAVYKFRYRIYCELLKRTQLYADHDRKRIVEPLDENGSVLVATINGRTVGTLRINRADDPYATAYRNFYRMQEISGLNINHCTITTKMMVDQENKMQAIGMKLAKYGFIHSKTRGSLIDFIDCNPPKEAYFRRLGYRYLFPQAIHPEFGLVTKMVLIFNDRRHLQNVRSPFASLASDQDSHPEWVRGVLKKISDKPIDKQED